MTGLFITGTDTGVGKTFVSAGIARALRRRGIKVRVCKPVATGAEETPAGWVSADTEQLAEAAGQPCAGVTRFTFREPAAPPLATRLEGRTLALADIVAAVRAAARDDSFLLVEGVGGLLCPLTEEATVADLAAAIGLPLLVVASRALGTMNHTLLTLEVARQRRLAVAGLVVSATTPVAGLAETTLIEELRRYLACPILAVVPHRADITSPCPELDAVEWETLGARDPS